MIRYKGKSPPERVKEPDLSEQLPEALKTSSGAAFGLMVRRSTILSRISAMSGDFRWAALRCGSTFKKPDLIALVQEQDEVRKLLDEASKTEGQDALRIQGLRERYRSTILDEALIVAATHGDEEQARRLLEMGADPNANGQKPLTAAASSGYGAGILRLLLEHGASKDGTDALKIAKMYGHEENIRVLEG